MVDIGKILGKREEKYCLFFCFGMDSRFARRSNLNLFSISSRYLFRTRQTFQGIMTKYNHHLSRRRLKRCVFSIYSYDKKQWNIYICRKFVISGKRIRTFSIIFGFVAHANSSWIGSSILPQSLPSLDICRPRIDFDKRARRIAACPCVFSKRNAQ